MATILKQGNKYLSQRIDNSYNNQIIWARVLDLSKKDNIFDTRKLQDIYEVEIEYAGGYPDRKTKRIKFESLEKAKQFYLKTIREAKIFLDKKFI